MNRYSKGCRRESCGRERFVSLIHNRHKNKQIKKKGKKYAETTTIKVIGKEHRKNVSSFVESERFGIE